MAVDAAQRAKNNEKYRAVPVARRTPRKVAGSRLGDDGLTTFVAQARRDFKLKKEAEREKHGRALELRKQGHNYRTIAKQLDVSESTAHRYVRKALNEITAPEAEHILLIELERLEGLYLMSYTALAKSVQMSNGEDPHLGAMDRCLAIMRQKARLLGITDQQGNVTMVLGDQNVSVDQSTTNNAVIATGSKDEYIAALARAREAHGDNVGTPGTVTPDLLPQPAIEVTSTTREEAEDDE